LEAVRGVDQARRLPGVIDAVVEPKPGDAIADVRDGRSRPGHVLVQAPDRAGVQRILAEVRRLIRVDYDDASDVAPIETVESRVA